jgi:hypothetical protein
MKEKNKVIFEEILIDYKIIEELIISLLDCYYVSIEINKNSFKIINSKYSNNINIINPFNELQINKNKLSQLLIFLIYKYIDNLITSANNKIQIINLLNTNYNEKIQKVIEKNRQLLKKINYLKQYDFKKITQLKKTPNDLIILYLKDNIKLFYCNTLENYIKKENQYQKKYIKTLNQTKEIKTNKIYYRGNKLNHNLSSSLYRDKNTPKIEHIINNRIIQSMPYDFSLCETFFDKLTILKHFNCPSRLLDITANPLIAAFFALDNYDQQKTTNYGAVTICFPKSFSEIKNSKNSDSISLLSALCTTDKEKPSYELTVTPLIDELNLLYTEVSKLSGENPQNTISQYSKVFDKDSTLNKLIKDILEITQDNENYNFITFLNSFEIKFNLIKNLITQRKKKLIKVYSEKILNDIKELLFILQNDKVLKKYFFEGELQHQATLINPSFNLFIPDETSINKYYIVHPSINNERIKNQQGLFILISSILNKDKFYLKPNINYLNLFKNNKDKRIVFIINNNNGNFYKKLNTSFGINKGYIYPGLENKVNQIKNNVMFEYGIDENREE